MSSEKTDALGAFTHDQLAAAAEAARPKTPAEQARAACETANASWRASVEVGEVSRQKAQAAIAANDAKLAADLEAIAAEESGWVASAAATQPEWDEVEARFNAEHYPTPNLHDRVAAALKGEHPEPPPTIAKPTMQSLAAAGRLDLAAASFNESMARDPRVQRDAEAHRQMRAEMLDRTGYDPDDRPWNKPVKAAEPEPTPEEGGGVTEGDTDNPQGIDFAALRGFVSTQAQRRGR